MNNLPVYLIYSFFLRIILFLKHWYIDGFLFTYHKTILVLEDLDRFFALKITLLNLFRPLYQDNSFIGHLLGPFFRLALVLIGLVIYLAISLIALLIFFIWALIPLIAILEIFFNQNPLLLLKS